MRASWPSENLLLGLLAERPMHGYELARLVCDDEALRAIWHLKRSEVYFLLGKLLAQGHIAEGAADQVDGGQRRAGGPPRQVYEVTPSGRSLLEAWESEPVSSPRDLRAAFLAKLYLAHRRGPAQTLALLDNQRRVLRRWRERLSAAAPAESFLALANKLRLAQVEAGLRALDDIQAALSAPV